MVPLATPASSAMSCTVTLRIPFRATTRMAASQMVCFRNSSTTSSFVRKMAGGYTAVTGQSMPVTDWSPYVILSAAKDLRMRSRCILRCFGVCAPQHDVVRTTSLQRERYARAAGDAVLRGGGVVRVVDHGVAVRVDAGVDAHLWRQRLAHHRVGGAEVDGDRERAEGDALDGERRAGARAGVAGHQPDHGVRRDGLAGGELEGDFHGTAGRGLGLGRGLGIRGLGAGRGDGGVVGGELRGGRLLG